MKASKVEKIEKKIGEDDFMLVIINYDKIRSSIFELSQMMQEKNISESDIREYVNYLVEDASDEYFNEPIVTFYPEGEEVED
jgi:hypothetical protein